MNDEATERMAEFEQVSREEKDAVIGPITVLIEKVMEMLREALGGADHVELTLIIRHKEHGPHGALLADPGADPEVLKAMIDRLLKLKNREPGVDVWSEGKRIEPS